MHSARLTCRCHRASCQEPDALVLPASEAAWRTAKERRQQIKNIKMGGVDESTAESRVDDAFGGEVASVFGKTVNRRHAVIDAMMAI